MNLHPEPGTLRPGPPPRADENPKPYTLHPTSLNPLQIISEAYPDRALLRRHPEPLEKGLQEVEKLCAATGLALNGTTSLELQRLLERVAERGNDVLAMVVRQQVLGRRV